MGKFLILTAISLIIMSCGKEQMEVIQIPDNLGLDLNRDGIVDFTITYSQQIEGFPIDPGGTLEVIRGKLVSENNNQVLKSENGSVLFLNDVNLIEDSISPPLFWESNLDESSNTIVTIRQNFNGDGWQNEWRIANEETKETYLIGFKLLNDDISNLGSMEISIDSHTGHVELLNINFL